MKAIVITGTPATGKTTLAKLLAQRFSLPCIDAKAFAKEHKLITGQDKVRDSSIIDEKKWALAIEKYMDDQSSDGLILVEGLISHFLSPKYTLLCIVTNCPLPELKKRLTLRAYAPVKVQENLQAEAFNECFVEAAEQGHTPYALNPSDKAQLALLLAKLSKIMVT